MTFRLFLLPCTVQASLKEVRFMAKVRKKGKESLNLKPGIFSPLGAMTNTYSGAEICCGRGNTQLQQADMSHR